MKEVGTLQELGLKPDVGNLRELGVKAGDVVECIHGVSVYDIVVITPHTNHPRTKLCKIGEMYALSRDGNNHQSVSESFNPQWRVVSRAITTPKLWRDMTPEEKGALLLAAHEGKVIEWLCGIVWFAIKPGWKDNVAYRIKPEPKIESIQQGYKINTSGKFVTTSSLDHATHRITFNLIDGKPDCASVKMEVL